jgi:hypothetical protein
MKIKIKGEDKRRRTRNVQGRITRLLFLSFLTLGAR